MKLNARIALLITLMALTGQATVQAAWYNPMSWFKKNQKKAEKMSERAAEAGDDEADDRAELGEQRRGSRSR